MPKVSVIVPVHNSLKTLNDCVFSLISQTLSDIEIILVDDCSTDETPVLLEAWAQEVPQKIRVLKTPINLGAGGARNYGIEQANGKYIGFADSDDVVEKTMYEKLYLEAEKTGYDIIDSGFYNESKDSAIIFTSDDCTGNLDSYKRNKLIVSGGYIWSKLYRRELFEDELLRMRSNCILEDFDFLTYLFATADTIGNVKEILYCYKNQENSLSKEDDALKYHSNICGAMNAIYEKCFSLSIYDEIKKSIEYCVIQLYVFGVINVLKYYLQNKEYSKNKCIPLLIELFEIKQKFISGNEIYDIYDNEFINNKIAKQDLECAILNDKNPAELLRKVKI